VEEATGFLIRPKDAEGMAAAIVRLLDDDDLSRRLGQNAVRDARQRYDLRRQAKAFLQWYGEVLQDASAR
jgi:glycosyltransferase involved in cell wall biosynthesis